VGNLYKVEFENEQIENVNVALLDMNGKQVAFSLRNENETGVLLDLGSNQNGIYILRIQLNDYLVSKKIIVRK